MVLMMCHDHISSNRLALAGLEFTSDEQKAANQPAAPRQLHRATRARSISSRLIQHIDLSDLSEAARLGNERTRAAAAHGTVIRC